MTQLYFLRIFFYVLRIFWSFLIHFIFTGINDTCLIFFLKKSQIFTFIFYLFIFTGINDNYFDIYEQNKINSKYIC